MATNRSKRSGILAALELLEKQHKAAGKMVAELEAYPPAARDKWWRGMHGHWTNRLAELRQALEETRNGAVRTDQPRDSEHQPGRTRAS